MTRGWDQTYNQRASSQGIPQINAGVARKGARQRTELPARFPGLGLGRLVLVVAGVRVVALAPPIALDRTVAVDRKAKLKIR